MIGGVLVVVALVLSSAVDVAGQGGVVPTDSGLIHLEDYRYFDEPVIADLFLMRPGEELVVTFVRTKLPPLRLLVDPSGRLVDQTLGVFDLGGRTLADAESELMPVLERLFNAAEIAISVSSPRRVAVHVSGAVASPGLYYGFTSQRVSEIVELAGGVLSYGSTRYIKLRGGPEVISVDLDLVRYLGDNSANPCLYAGSAIHVPARASARVQVVGEVNTPRDLELVEGDTPGLMVSLAGGARGAAAAAAALVIRGGTTVSNPSDLLPGDVIMVPSRRDAGIPGLMVFGAVTQPGRYAYTEGMTLGQLHEACGGLTTEAAPGLTTVFRRAVTDEWGRTTEERYPISTAVSGGRCDLGTPLNSDDSVFVPYRVGYVKVSGAVVNPGRFPFVEGEAAEFYVNTAGGYLPTADRKHVDIYNRVARTTTSVSPQVQMHDGDELVVNVREELR